MGEEKYVILQKNCICLQFIQLHLEITMRDEHWLETWKEYMAYLRRNKRRPSKYRIEDMKLVNWLKYNRKIRNKGLLSEERSEKLDVLMKELKNFGGLISTSISIKRILSQTI